MDQVEGVKVRVASKRKAVVPGAVEANVVRQKQTCRLA